MRVTLQKYVKIYNNEELEPLGLNDDFNKKKI
jgi:hypothetical protein